MTLGEGTERKNRESKRYEENEPRLAQEVLFSLVTEESCMNLALGNAVSFSHHPMPTPYAYIDMAQKS